MTSSVCVVPFKSGRHDVLVSRQFMEYRYPPMSPRSALLYGPRRRGVIRSYMGKLTGPHSVYKNLVVEFGGKPVAMLAVATVGASLYLGSAYTLPAFRHRGYMRLLIEHALTEGKALGACSAYSYVFEGNAASLRMMQRLGFRLTLVKRRYVCCETSWAPAS